MKLPAITGPQAAAIAVVGAIAIAILGVAWWMVAHDKDPTGIIAVGIGAIASAVMQRLAREAGYQKGKSELPPSPPGTEWRAVPSIAPPLMPSGVDLTSYAPSGQSIPVSVAPPEKQP